MRMQPIVAWVVALVFVLLGALHVFWAFGGKWGTAAAIPRVDGQATISPSRTVTLLVAAALTSAAVVVALQAGLLPGLARPYPRAIAVASFVLGAVFVARAIGDFRVAGFFKTVRGTDFARYDSLLFSPLCLVLGVSVLWLTFW